MTFLKHSCDSLCCNTSRRRRRKVSAQSCRPCGHWSGYKKGSFPFISTCALFTFLFFSFIRAYMYMRKIVSRAQWRLGHLGLICICVRYYHVLNEGSVIYHLYSVKKFDSSHNHTNKENAHLSNNWMIVRWMLLRIGWIFQKLQHIVCIQGDAHRKFHQNVK